jgi:hypothetical protein
MFRFIHAGFRSLLRCVFDLWKRCHPFCGMRYTYEVYECMRYTYTSVPGIPIRVCLVYLYECASCIQYAVCIKFGFIYLMLSR